MPKAWCYARASHAEQYAKKALGVEVCNTVDRQVEACKRYWEYQLQPKGIEWGGYEPEQHAVSASKTKFLERPAAKRLMNLMQPGDHLIFDKVDRMWRRLHDYTRVDEAFQRRGIAMHIVNLMGASVSRGTPFGDFALGLMVLLAQMESQQLSDRLKANAAWRRSRKLPNAKKYLGFKSRGAIGNRQLVPDMSERAIMQAVVRYRDNDRLPWWRISDEVEKMLCAHEGVEYKQLRFADLRKDPERRRWPVRRCMVAYEAEMRLQADGM